MDRTKRQRAAGALGRFTVGSVGVPGLALLIPPALAAAIGLAVAFDLFNAQGTAVTEAHDFTTQVYVELRAAERAGLGIPAAKLTDKVFVDFRRGEREPLRVPASWRSDPVYVEHRADERAGT
jgi:hypothetical protein